MWGVWFLVKSDHNLISLRYSNTIGLNSEGIGNALNKHPNINAN